MLHPQVTCETGGKIFNHLLEALFTSQQMPGKMVEEVKREFTKFLQDVTAHKEEFLGFDMAVKDHFLNAFCFKYLEGRLSFSNFAESLKMVLTLCHGQASV